MKSIIELMIIAMASTIIASQAYAGCGACGGHDEKKDEGKKEEVKPAEKAKEPAKKTEFKTLTTEEMKKTVEAKNAVILDARSGKWDDGKRIPGAKSLNAASKKEDVEKLIPSKDAKIVTYCAGTTCPASEKLAKHLKELGYTDITEYPEGIQGWTSAGNSTE